MEQVGVPTEQAAATKASRPRKRDRFVPYSAEQASVIARQVAQEYAANPSRHSSRRNPCRACVCENRVDVDKLLLMAAPFPKVRQALGSNYNHHQMVRHRDFHLLPHVAGMQPTTEQLLLLAWPADEDRRAKVRFYTALAFGIFHESLKAGDRRNALAALREMARLDLEVSTTPLGAAQALELPAPMPDIVKPSPADDAILDRAIRLSARPRPSQEPETPAHRESTAWSQRRAPSAGQSSNP